MKIKVLGCSGAEMPGFYLPAFLIDDSILLDAGTTAGALNETAQGKITHILLTHAHLDHIRGIPFLADNMLLRSRKHSVTLIGIEKVLNTLRENIFNNSIWPDFTNIPTPQDPALRLKDIEPNRYYRINGYNVMAQEVSHSVKAAGYIIKDPEGKCLIYTGDTGPTADLWEMANKDVKNHMIDGVIIEVTLQNDMRELALRTGHLTPEMLFEELKKLKHLPRKIFITHLKPQLSDTIVRELKSLRIKQMTILKDGKTYII